MLTAQNRHATKAKTTESGREPPAKTTPAGIEAAIAAPGAISVMLWNVTSRRPMAFRRSPAVVALAVSVVIDVLQGRGRSMPGCSHGRYGSHQRISHWHRFRVPAVTNVAAGAAAQRQNRLMHADRPEPREPDGRERPRPFDDLRERLARLPPGHPSSERYGDRAGEPDGPGVPAGTGDRAEADGCRQAEGAEETDRLDGSEEPDGTDEPGGRATADPPGVRGSHRPGGWPARRRADGGPAPAGPEAFSRTAPYRPWFCGEPPRPWFSDDPRDRSS